MRQPATARGFPAVYSHHDIVSKTIAKNGYWEITDPRDLGTLGGAELPPLPATFMDIGANMGFYTLLFAHAGFRVVSLEPLEHNRRAIEASLCLNPVLASRVQLVPVALGLPVGESACVIESTTVNNRGNGVMRCGPGMACGRQGRKLCESVALRRLDDVLADPHLGIDRVDVVKVDIEGAECDMLAGGRRLFDRWRPKLVQMELKQRKVAACALASARAHGFTVGTRRGHDQNAVMVDSSYLASHPLLGPPGGPRRRLSDAGSVR